jgi:hypothetical protein
MANDDSVDNAAMNNQQTEKTADQVALVMEQILSDHPHLRTARESIRRDDEPTDKFAREFLRVFRHRLQG